MGEIKIITSLHYRRNGGVKILSGESMKETSQKDTDSLGQSCFGRNFKQKMVCFYFLLAIIH